jgi:hypothetical protein
MTSKAKQNLSSAREPDMNNKLTLRNLRKRETTGAASGMVLAIAVPGSVG